MCRRERERSICLDHISIKPDARLDWRPRDIRASNLTSGEVDQHPGLLALEDCLAEGCIIGTLGLGRDCIARQGRGYDHQGDDQTRAKIRQAWLPKVRVSSHFIVDRARDYVHSLGGSRSEFYRLMIGDNFADDQVVELLNELRVEPALPGEGSQPLQLH